MLGSFSLLFAVLIAVPGLLIPLYIIWRMAGVLKDEHRERGEKAFAGGTVLAMILLMGIAVYAAQEITRILNVLA